MLSTKLEALPINAITHIQKIAPGPPKDIAIATPAKFPLPTLAAVLIQNAWQEETPLFSFQVIDFPAPSPKSLNICPNSVN